MSCAATKRGLLILYVLVPHITRMRTRHTKYTRNRPPCIVGCSIRGNWSNILLYRVRVPSSMTTPPTQETRPAKPHYVYDIYDIFYHLSSVATFPLSSYVCTASYRSVMYLYIDISTNLVVFITTLPMSFLLYQRVHFSHIPLVERWVVHI